MTDRAQPGAIDSLIRNDELAQVFGRFSEGFIVPGSDPTPAAQRRGNIDETALDAFSLTTSASSLDVTVAPGEAFVSGWVCRDVDTTLTLPANSTVDIVVGFNPDAIFDPNVDADRDAADETVVDLSGNVDPTTPTTVAHRVTTDGSGVTSSDRIARVGSALDVESVSTTDLLTDSLSATSISTGTLTDQITDTQLDTSSGFFSFGSNDARLDTGQAIETPSAERVEFGQNTIISADDGTQEFAARGDTVEVGRGAGNNNPKNTIVGFQAAGGNIGNEIVAVGREALDGNNTDPRICAVGFRSAFGASGEGTTAVGSRSAKNDSGFRTIALGQQSGEGNSGDGVIAIGFEAAANNSQNDILVVTDSGGTRRLEMDLTNGDLKIEGSLTQNASL